MKTNPRVSVIIPNYNHAKYLQSRTDSIINQTFQDFEIIILDDASTDDSQKVLKAYAKHPKVSHFIVNEKNSGSPFEQWGRAYKLVSGKYIWIAESDDFAHPEFLEKTVYELENKPAAGLVYTDSKIIDSKGVLLGKSSDKKNNYFKTDKWSFYYAASGIDEVLDFLLYRVTINNVSAVLFRKDTFDKIDFNVVKQYSNTGDLYVYSFILIDHDISYIPEALNSYRIHGENLTELNTQSGYFFMDALSCYSGLIDLFVYRNLNAKENKRLSKAFKYFINRFGIRMLQFGLLSDLIKFVNKLSKSKILGGSEARGLIVLLFFHYHAPRRIKNYLRELIRQRTVG